MAQWGAAAVAPLIGILLLMIAGLWQRRRQRMAEQIRRDEGLGAGETTFGTVDAAPAYEMGLPKYEQVVHVENVPERPQQARIVPA
ncbi:hypothetical protein PYCC9005_005861 [Savitreella phatthalungensis]